MATSAEANPADWKLHPPLGNDGGNTREVAMRLGMVRTAAGEPSVAVQRERDGNWVPVLTAPGADPLGRARTDLLALLDAGEQARQLAQELAEQAPPPDPPRNCSACRSAQPPSGTARCGRERMIGVARGLLRLRESAAGRSPTATSG